MAELPVLPQCSSCGRHHWYPKSRCPHCGGPWSWQDISGDGVAVTWTEVHHDFGAGTGFTLPIPVVLAAPAEAPEVHLVGVAAQCLPLGALHLDERVTVRRRVVGDAGGEVVLDVHAVGCGLEDAAQ